MSDDAERTQPAPAEPEPALEEDTLAARVRRIGAAIAHELSPGDVAALRRLGPGDVAVPAFWKLAASCLVEALPQGGEARDLAERRWAAIASGMAVTAGLHRAGRRAGAALAEAGYSELRLERLLRAQGDQLLVEVRGAARFLAAKAVELDWAELAALVLADPDEPSGDAVRRGLARAYFWQLHRNERSEVNP